MVRKGRENIRNKQEIGGICFKRRGEKEEMERRKVNRAGKRK